MQQSVQSGSGRRDERMPLDALIELRSEDGEQMLEADGVDLSPGGLSLRASFVPPIGAQLTCHFRCPPNGEPVRAQGEVVWAAWSGPRHGSFGMRFVELDTKSATAIRRYVEPEAVEEPAPAAAPPRVATMRIDGLGAPIDADVRLHETGSIVLEQELTFLKLGRGVEVDVPGRGKERGRIASIELRHSALDVPTLVFGILLDEAPELDPRSVAEPAAATSSMMLDSDFAPAPSARDTWPERAISMDAPEPAVDAAATVQMRELSPSDEPPVTMRKAVEAPKKKASARKADEPRVVRASEVAPEPVDEHAEDLAAIQNRMPVALLALKRMLVNLLVTLRLRLMPALRELFQGTEGATKNLRADALPKAREQLSVQLSRVRLLATTQWGRLRAFQRARSEKKPRTTAPAPRVQKSSHAAPRAEAPVKREPPKNRRLFAMALAVVGIGLGVYVLAPRSTADRIRVRHRSSSIEPVSSAPIEPVAQGPAAVTQPTEPMASPTPAAQPVAATAVAPAAEPSAAVQPAEPTGKLTFGASEVPNGRTFALRMSGPVESVEGESREDGFTVRVPGRLALDRASPIATSHRAVARAMILNRGDYAELTVDFLPGMRPKYQIIGKDNTIEVTLERL